MVVRTGDAVQEARSGLRSGGAAVALMMELMPCHSIHAAQKHTPCIVPYSEDQVVTWRYGQATQALRKIVTESGGNPEEVALHSLRIRGDSALAPGEPCRSE